MSIKALLARPTPFRILGRPIAYLWAEAARWSSRRVGLVVCYHRIGDPQGDPERELVPALGTPLFAAQLGHLKRRYRVVPASRLRDAVVARRRGGRFPVAVTFDDDLRSHAEVALPLLRRAGVPAAFFVCGASLDRPFAFWWERLQAAADAGTEPASLVPPDAPAPPAVDGDDAEPIHRAARAIQTLEPDLQDAVAARLQAIVGPDPPEAGMPAADVRALVQAGFEIGFHTLRHRWLPTLDDDRLNRAMRDGREQLEAAAGATLTMIAYPHGGGDQRVAAAALAAGYTLGFRTSDEAVEPDSDPLVLGRLEPAFDSLGRFAFDLARTLARGRWR